LPSIASTAAVAADWPKIMKTGSMRMLPKAMCELEAQTGTSKLLAYLFRRERTVRDLIRPVGRNADVPFILHVGFRTVSYDIPLDIMRINALGSHPDGIGRGPLFEQVLSLAFFVSSASGSGRCFGGTRTPAP